MFKRSSTRDQRWGPDPWTTKTKRAVTCTTWLTIKGREEVVRRCKLAVGIRDTKEKLRMTDEIDWAVFDVTDSQLGDSRAGAATHEHLHQAFRFVLSSPIAT